MSCPICRSSFWVYRFGGVQIESNKSFFRRFKHQMILRNPGWTFRACCRWKSKWLEEKFSSVKLRNKRYGVCPMKLWLVSSHFCWIINLINWDYSWFKIKMVESTGTLCRVQWNMELHYYWKLSELMLQVPFFSIFMIGARSIASQNTKFISALYQHATSRLIVQEPVAMVGFLSFGKCNVGTSKEITHTDANQMQLEDHLSLW